MIFRSPVRSMMSTAFLAALVLGLSAQGSGSSAGFLNYGINLLPDTGGTLNARISLEANWLPWLSTDLLLATDNYTESYDEATDVSTFTSTGRSATLGALRVDEDLVDALFGVELPFLRFSVGIVGAYDHTDQRRYGYDPTASPALFYIDESVRSAIRPLQSYTLGLALGPVLLSGNFESTMYWSAETASTSHYSSEMSQVPEPTLVDYLGGDTLAGAGLELDLGFAKAIGGFEYYRHLMTDGTVSGTNMSETWTYRGALLLRLIKLAGGSPLVGASLVRKSDYFATGDRNLETSKVRLEFGIGY